ncbi:MAG: ATP-binding cassette domain-containing protein [Candidatus Brocadiia bacterium]
MISIENLSKHFAGFAAVDGISLAVEKGDILGFLGPNGAGKTTTMRVITSFIPPTSGRVTIFGHDVVRDSLKSRACIGYLPESVPFYPELRVGEYLEFRARLKGVPARERTQRLEQVMDKCRIKDVETKIIGHLSKGYRQRVGMADAIIHNPPILILDEPTIGLDPNQIRQVRDLIKELGQERTIIISTHILPEVEMICNRVVIINKGKIAASDTLSNLVRDAAGRGKVLAEIKGPKLDVESALRQIPGVTAVEANEVDGWNLVAISAGGQDIRELVYKTAAEHKWVIRELGRKQETLEELFVRITAREQN